MMLCAFREPSHSHWGFITRSGTSVENIQSLEEALRLFHKVKQEVEATLSWGWKTVFKRERKTLLNSRLDASFYDTVCSVSIGTV